MILDPRFKLDIIAGGSSSQKSKANKQFETLFNSYTNNNINDSTANTPPLSTTKSKSQTLSIVQRMLQGSGSKSSTTNSLKSKKFIGNTIVPQ
jgi:hypothetical protein